MDGGTGGQIPAKSEDPFVVEEGMIFYFPDGMGILRADQTAAQEIPIPDYVFEAILEQRRIYEKNRRRRSKEFRDWDYICCSTYGNPRSKSYHQKYYKELLASLGLPDIHFHQLRNTMITPI